MSDNKKQLNALKKELNQYKKKLSAAESSFKGKAGKEGDKILQSLQGIVKEAGESYDKLESASAEEWEPLKNIATQSFEELKNAFEEAKEYTIDQAKDYAHQIEEYSEEAFESGIEYIKTNPFKSVLLAVGAGFVIGRILK